MQNQLVVDRTLATSGEYWWSGAIYRYLPLQQLQ